MAVPTHLQELPSDELGGATGAKYFHVLFVGKPNSPEFPYNVVNEKVASELGRACGLHVPEILILQHGDEHLVLSRCLQQTESGETAAPRSTAEYERYFDTHRDAVHGMLCFDLLVCNNDRGPGHNVILDDGDRLWLIDHGNALMYRPRDGIEAGIPRLEAVRDDLRSLLDKPHRFLQAGYLSDLDLTRQWCDRIAAVPEHFIEFVLDELPDDLLTVKEREFLRGFLSERRGSLADIIESNWSWLSVLREGR